MFTLARLAVPHLFLANNTAAHTLSLSMANGETASIAVAAGASAKQVANDANLRI